MHRPLHVMRHRERNVTPDSVTLSEPPRVTLSGVEGLSKDEGPAAPREGHSRCKE